MRLLKKYLIRERKEIEENNIHLTAIGRIDGLPADVRKELDISIEKAKTIRGWYSVLRLIMGPL